MKKIVLILASCALLFSSCNDWLDITPKVNVEEADLFRNEQGFKEALTGVYMRMCESDLYGKDLTYGFLDILAQRYYNNENWNDLERSDYSNPNWYTFPSKFTEGYTEAFWSGHYNLIANLNNFLKNFDKNGQVIRDSYRDIMKGEALGLRSFLYFDLLRMYGPVYKDNPTSPTLPYRTKFDREVVKLMPANQIADSLIATLKEAEILLAKDPMHTPFYGYNEDEQVEPFLQYRFNRMNRCAVQAELARVYLWIGDKKNAYDYAKKVVEAVRSNGSRQFALVTDNSQDPLCSTELIFSLSMDSETFPDRVKQDFMLANWNFNVIIGDGARLGQIFDVAVDGQNDMRYRAGTGFEISPNGAVTLKYKQEDLKSPAVENNMPLIRLPEMYYIMAECTEDLAEAAKYLSLVRGARGVDELPAFAKEEDRMYNIEKEYRKEFYAEGQLWHFYKRLGYKTFMFCPIEEMKEENYRFSIPDDEIILGDIN